LPLGPRSSLTLLVPIVRTDIAGNEDYDLGDASLKLSYVYKLTKDHGIVLQGEVVFDTAGRPEDHLRTADSGHALRWQQSRRFTITLELIPPITLSARYEPKTRRPARTEVQLLPLGRRPTL